MDVQLAADIFDHDAFAGSVVHDVMRLWGEAPVPEHDRRHDDVADIGLHFIDAGEIFQYPRPDLPSPVQLGPVKLVPTGQGSGMLGLPGDFTPPSRFVRAVAFSQSVFKSKTGDDAISMAFHVLNQFDIPKGSARDGEKDANGNIQADYTLWTAASDLKTRRYYFRTYDDSQTRVVDLMKMNVDGKDIVRMSIKGDGVIKPLTQ